MCSRNNSPLTYIKSCSFYLIPAYNLANTLLISPTALFLLYFYHFILYINKFKIKVRMYVFFVKTFNSQIPINNIYLFVFSTSFINIIAIVSIDGLNFVSPAEIRYESDEYCFRNRLDIFRLLP